MNLNEASGNSSGVASSALAKRSDSPGPSKVSDILKRKVPPKRKSQNSNRSKTRQEEPSSVVQDLINRATNLGELRLNGRNGGFFFFGGL